ncbi:MAG: DUF5615 family PIN-like protein [Dehalococcoidia bacterium]|nr:DUF5615 family PIN-like protein [Dehalococcoidia bacterium]
MIALYLDENVPPLIARLLQAEGYDVISAYEVGMPAQDDEEQLKYAASSGRAILTFNQKHFRPLYDQWWISGRSHSGIVLSKEYKLEEIGDFVRLVRNLIVRSNSADMANSFTLTWRRSLSDVEVKNPLGFRVSITPPVPLMGTDH